MKAILFLILATIITVIGAFMTLSSSILVNEKDDEETDKVIVAVIAATVTIGVLSVIAGIFKWWFFGPILILAFGIWQKIAYTHWAWLNLAGLVMIGNIAAGPGKTAMAWLTSGLTKLVIIPAAVLIFIGLSLLSIREDKLAALVHELKS